MSRYENKSSRPITNQSNVKGSNKKKKKLRDLNIKNMRDKNKNIIRMNNVSPHKL